MNWRGNPSWHSRPGIGAPLRLFSARASRETPMASADSEGGLLVRPQELPLPRSDKAETKWKRQIVAARIAWARLTVDELIALEGSSQKLAILIQERYDITSDEAEKRVARFFACR